MATQLVTTDQSTRALTSEGERFALRQRQARMFATSPLVPEHLRKGTPDQAMANCYIALTLAEAMGEVPLVVMQNIHVVNGKAGFASQYMIARANASGIFHGRIDWRIDRSNPQNLSVTALAVLKDTGQEVSFTCDMAMAKAEAWTKNSKYQSMPEVMLRYRSAAFLIRFYAPDVMLGYRTVEEYEDIAGAARPDSEPVTAAALLEQASEDREDEAETVEVTDAEDDEGGKPNEERGEPDANVADTIIEEIGKRETVPDVNSYVSGQKDTILALGDEDRDRVAVAQQARVDAIKGVKA